MPYGDGTGPNGMGPMTGGGFGNCGSRAGQSYGRGAPYGRGGRGRGFGMGGGGFGRGRRAVGWRAAPAYQGYNYPNPDPGYMPDAQEMDTVEGLRARIAELEKRLSDIDNSNRP